MRAALVLIAALAAACGSSRPLNPDFFGPTIEPPCGLARIQPGISVAEARRRLPGLKEDRRGVRDQLVLDSGVSDVTLEVRIDSGTVASIFAIVQGHGARDMLTRTWGQPQITRDSLGQPETTWASESTGWKVKLDCLERNCFIEYVPYHVLTSEFFGAHVVPPGELANLRIGMKVADARKIAPGPIDVRAGIATGVDGVREFVAIDDKTATVRAIYLNLPQHAEDLIAEAWSEGWRATEPVGKTVLVWPDPTTGWRATLRDALGYSHDLAYDNFLPAAQLFGDQPDQLEALPEPVLGRSVEEVKKAYKDAITVAGHDLVVTMLPTEWERTATRITLVASGGVVRRIVFSLPYRPHPEARDTLLELFKRKWGEPRTREEDGKPVLVFRDEEPRVEILEDTEHGAWKVEIR
ncbi:MAG TPA: hypothetical protein VFD36_02595 [Kofleriaceae bacterium]|nr:hypothetical protein [Kofleriaceae bacterium]